MKKVFFSKGLQFLNREAAPAHFEQIHSVSSAELERQASDLSSYGGGGPGYLGVGDDFLEFTGKEGSFIDPINSGKLYTITLINADSTHTRYALLCPGLLFTAAVGLIVTGAFNDSLGNSGLSASGTPLAIEYFTWFVHEFPTICVGFKVTTSNITQMDQVITIQKQSPFQIHSSRIINPAVYANEANPQTGLISVEESFYMDNQTLITYGVLPSTTVTLGLFFGVSLNISRALRAKTERAKATISANGLMPMGPSSFRGRR